MSYEIAIAKKAFEELAALPAKVNGQIVRHTGQKWLVKTPYHIDY